MLEAYQHAWSDVRKVVLVQSEGDTLLYKAVPRLSLVVHAGLALGYLETSGPFPKWQDTRLMYVGLMRWAPVSPNSQPLEQWAVFRVSSHSVSIS